MERTENQKNAARINGAKSHGPVTPEGKRHSAASSPNARQAVLARTVLLPGESRDRFNELYQSFIADFLPTTPIELALVEKMVVAHWKQMRGWSMERASLAASAAAAHHSTTHRDPEAPHQAPTHEINHELHDENHEAHDPERHALALVRPGSLASQIRGYETSCERVFSRSLDRLLKLRAARRQNENSRPEADN